MTAYSHKSLQEKLDLKNEMAAAIIQPPLGYVEQLSGSDRAVITDLKPELEFIHYFATSKNELTQMMPKLKEHLKIDGMLWISWQKQAAHTDTDLDENMVREIGLENGLVDVKVIAVDETWSGLKFVVRLVNR